MSNIFDNIKNNNNFASIKIPNYKVTNNKNLQSFKDNNFNKSDNKIETYDLSSNLEDGTKNDINYKRFIDSGNQISKDANKSFLTHFINNNGYTLVWDDSPAFDADCSYDVYVNGEKVVDAVTGGNSFVDLSKFHLDINKVVIKNHKTNEVIKDSEIKYEISYEEIENDGFTPQGIVGIEDKFFISSYKSGENSRIYVYDKQTGKNEAIIELDNKAHVGGIDYDEETGNLYISGYHGDVNIYDYSVINEIMELNKKDNNGLKKIDINELTKHSEKIKLPSNVTVSDKTLKGVASSLCVYKGVLYVATYDTKFSGQLVGFDIKTNKVVALESVPKGTQGICFTEYNGSEYLLTSQSVGNSNSMMTVYKMNGGKKELQGFYNIDRTKMEQITADKNGNITAVYEDEKNHTVTTNIADILNNLDDYPDDAICRYFNMFGANIIDNFNYTVNTVNEATDVINDIIGG